MLLYDVTHEVSGVYEVVMCMVSDVDVCCGVWREVAWEASGVRNPPSQAGLLKNRKQTKTDIILW